MGGPRPTARPRGSLPRRTGHCHGQLGTVGPTTMPPIKEQRRASVTYARTSAFSDLDHQLIGPVPTWRRCPQADDPLAVAPQAAQGTGRADRPRAGVSQAHTASPTLSPHLAAYRRPSRSTAWTSAASSGSLIESIGVSSWLAPFCRTMRPASGSRATPSPRSWSTRWSSE